MKIKGAHAAWLIRRETLNDFTTAHVTFKNFSGNPGPTYTYCVPKSWQVVAGEQLLVYARGNLTVVTVVSVDAEPELDINRDYNYLWAVSKIDFTDYRNRTEDNADAERMYNADYDEISFAAIESVIKRKTKSLRSSTSTQRNKYVHNQR